MTQGELPVPPPPAAAPRPTLKRGGGPLCRPSASGGLGRPPRLPVRTANRKRSVQPHSFRRGLLLTGLWGPTRTAGRASRGTIRAFQCLTNS